MRQQGLKILYHCLKNLIKTVRFLHKKVIIPFFRSTRRMLGPFLVGVYGFYLYIKKRFGKTYSASTIQIFTRTINKYGPHLSVSIIVLFVVTHNLQVTAKTGVAMNDQSIMGILLGTGVKSEFIEETAAMTQQTDFKKKYVSNYAVGESTVPLMETEAEQKNEIATLSTMAGGNTLMKPLITDTDNPISKQNLIDTITYHTVQEGDTISSIAEQFGISINTILWENNLRSRDYIKPGQKLTILPTSGIRHIVKAGESITKISAKYNIDEEKILSFNNIENAGFIKPGQKLIIPEGAPPYTPTVITRQPTISEKLFNKSSSTPNPQTGMIWPTSGRVITQYWSWNHFGLDIDGITGDPLYSVLPGVVLISGWNNGGYGLQVVVDHENGTKTRYAHCSKLLHSPGDRVSQGEPVCLMGNTGRSTGSHIHFEVIVNGVRRNPLNYLKR